MSLRSDGDLNRVIISSYLRQCNLYWRRKRKLKRIRSSLPVFVRRNLVVFGKRCEKLAANPILVMWHHFGILDVERAWEPPGPHKIDPEVYYREGLRDEYASQIGSQMLCAVQELRRHKQYCMEILQTGFASSDAAGYYREAAVSDPVVAYVFKTETSSLEHALEYYLALPDVYSTGITELFEVDIPTELSHHPRF